MSSITGSPRRARSEPRRRAAAALAAAVLAALAAACDLDRERDTPPSLVIAPGGALQGAALTVLLTAPGSSLSECQGLGGDSLGFTFGDQPAPIEAATLEVVDTDTLRARLFVAMSAEPGDCQVVLHCDALTEFRGAFSVRERLQDPVVALDPSEIKAGSSAQIHIVGEEIAFSEDATHVVFGTGEYVTVRDQVVVDGAAEMWVTIDVAPLTPPTVDPDADGGAEAEPMEVAVITGDLVARGELAILPRDTPWIQVVPDSIDLNPPDQPSAQRSLEITGTGVVFVQPTAGADGGVDEEGTVVAFPENPGLQVTSVVVDGDDSASMTVTVLAEAGTAIGTTPLTVTTGEEIVSAAFTVYPPAEGPGFLALTPAHLPRGARSDTVVVTGCETAPFAPGDPAEGDVHFDEAGCHLERFERFSDTVLLVGVSVDSDFTGDACTLRVDASAGALVGKLAVVAPTAPILSGFTSVAQGAGGVWLSVDATEVMGVEPAVFDIETTVSVSERSGFDIVTAGPYNEGQSLFIVVAEVADDAPLGRASLHIDDDDVDFLVEYSVVPSEDTPANVLVEPGTVPAGAREATFRLESVDPTGDGSSAEMLLFDAGAPPEVSFDNPAIRATALEVLGQTSAVVDAEILPGIAADMAVMYVTSGEAKAAASFRVLPEEQQVVSAPEPDLERGEETEIVFVEAIAPAGVFGPEHVVGDVFDGIGVEVLSLDLYENQPTPMTDALYLQVRVAPTGPTGWFGVLLTDGRGTAVLPLRILGAAADDDLTMAVAPATADGALHTGDQGVKIDALLPAVAATGALPAAARAGVPGAFARLDEIDGTAALLTVDVAQNAVATDDGIPLLVRVGPGAAVGFAPYVPAEPVGLAEGGSVDVFLEPTLNPVARIAAAADTEAAYAWVGLGEPAHADASLVCVADDELSAQGVSERGLVWLTGGGIATLLIRPVDPTEGLPSTVRLGSYDGALEVVAEDDGTPIAVGDPCAGPSLVAAEIGAPLDEDQFLVASTSGCEASAAVIARAMGGRPWSTPDVLLEIPDAGDAGFSRGWPTAAQADPRLYFDLGPTLPVTLNVAPELASAGDYLLNVRRSSVLREICGCDGAGPSYIELDMRPGTELAAFAVRLVDPLSLLYLELPLSGTVPADGVVRIGNPEEGEPDIVDTAGVTAFPAGEPFAVQLLKGGLTLDALQVDGPPGAGEGTPATSAGAPRCLARLASIDTNDNERDFVEGWLPTPGD